MIRFFAIISIFGCATLTAQYDTETDKNAIHTVLNSWHNAAANAEFETYFSYMTTNGVFIGTDATENWQNRAFRTFAKPYFDKGEAWSFTPVERHIYVDESSQIAWFDELLNTQMKLCRGSGVLKKIDAQWKIVHYVLSIVIPNEAVKKVVHLKKEVDDVLIEKLKKRPLKKKP